MFTDKLTHFLLFIVESFSEVREADIRSREIVKAISAFEAAAAVTNELELLSRKWVRNQSSEFSSLLE